MIDIAKENLFPFSELPKRCEKHLGKRIHPSTGHRWRINGVRGVKLESILAGGTRCTSEEALARFFNKSTAAADGHAAPTVLELDQREIDEAKRLLEQEGI